MRCTTSLPTYTLAGSMPSSRWLAEDYLMTEDTNTTDLD